MTQIILIRHSETKQNPQASSHTWQLTKRGRERCESLGKKLKPCGVSRIITSEEQKAILTGQLTADVLDIPCETAPALGETKRDTLPYFDKIEDFWAAIENGMRHPDDLVFGEETFTDARTRFANSIDALVAKYPDDKLAIVTHGTVMSLYVSHLTGEDVYTFWRSLQMPTYAILDLDSKSLVELTHITS